MQNSFYVNSLRLRATFFYLITALFILAVSIGICIQTSFYILSHQDNPTLFEIIICLVLNPIVFLIGVIFCNGMFDLIFDSMDNPPFLKFRSKIMTAFTENENTINNIIKPFNYFIILSFEFFPIFGGLLNIYATSKFDISHFAAGYLLGAVFLIFLFGCVYIFCNSIILSNILRQDRYYDYLKALEKLETEKGFLYSSKEKIVSFNSEDLDSNVKKPNSKLGVLFFVFAVFSIFLSILLTKPDFQDLLLSMIMSGLTLFFIGQALKFSFPKFLGLSFYFLVGFYFSLSIALTFIGLKTEGFNITKPIIPVSFKNNEKDQLIISNKSTSYPICKIKWQNLNLKNNDKYLSALDLTALSSTPYVYLEEHQKEFDYANNYIKGIFENTNLEPVSLEHFDDWKTFGRSAIVYFPELKMRVMIIRGTHTYSELLYDLNLFAFIELLNFFDIVTPVIGLLPDDLIQSLVKWADLRRFFNSKDMMSEVLSLADYYNNISLKNQDEFIIIGHSLGGVLAGMISAKLGISGVAISAPGTKHILKRYNINSDEKLHRSLTNIIFDNDLISQVDEHLGSINLFRCEYDDYRLCHDPNALLCKIYENCGDKNLRALNFSCSEDKFSSFYYSQINN